MKCITAESDSDGLSGFNKEQKMKDKITHQISKQWINESGKQLPRLELYLRLGEAFVLIRERPSAHVRLNAACHCLCNLCLRCSTHICRWTVFDLRHRWWRQTHIREVSVSWFALERSLERFQRSFQRKIFGNVGLLVAYRETSAGEMQRLKGGVQCVPLALLLIR